MRIYARDNQDYARICFALKHRSTPHYYDEKAREIVVAATLVALPSILDEAGVSRENVYVDSTE